MERLIKGNNILNRAKQFYSWPDIFLGLIVSSIFINILSLSFSILLLQIYDRVIPNASTNTLFILMSGVSIAIMIEGVLRYARTYVIAWADARFEYHVGSEVFHNILQLNISEYETSGEGVYLEKLNAVHTLKDFYNGQVITSLLDIPFIIMFIAFICYISGWLALIPTVILVLQTVIMIMLSKKLGEYLIQKRNFDDRRMNFIISVLSGIHSIKSMALEAQMERRYEYLQKKGAANDYHVSLQNAISTLISNGMLQLSTVFVLAFGSIMVMRDHLTIGGLSACVIITNRILQPAGRIASVWSRLQSVRIAEARLKKLASLKCDNNECPDVPVIQGKIQFEDVSFRYSESERLLIDKINIQIEPGEMVGITSDSGMGKTTLLLMILGILRPESGRILIDGHDISQYNSSSICEQVSYIAQHGVLFNGTILENVTMFRSQYNEKAKMICDLLGMTANIQKLPQGYDTKVGKQVVEFLSYGLKQRICIARALISGPRIILFDEANIAIDARSDSFLKEVLHEYRNRSTWILVSHRPSLLALTDRIFTFNSGKLEEIKQNEWSRSDNSTI